MLLILWGVLGKKVKFEGTWVKSVEIWILRIFEVKTFYLIYSKRATFLIFLINVSYYQVSWGVESTGFAGGNQINPIPYFVICGKDMSEECMIILLP